MSASGPLTEWYVARDGQQYGPLTDLEMRKFVELGHLRPTDLVWRQGFADWRPAPAVFPQRPLQTPLPRRPAQPAELAHRPASRSHETDGELRMGGDFHGYSAAARRQTAVATSAVSEPEAAELEDEPEAVEARPRRWGRRFLLLLALMAILGGAGWYAMNNPDLVSRVHVLMEARPEPAAETLRVAPFKPVGAVAAQVDEAFQRTALWQVIKREFPDWYADRVKEAVQLNAGDKRDEAAISRHFAEAVVGLRRQHAEQALAASPAALRTVAANFLASLKHLSEHSVDACYGFISQGETSPQILTLLGDPQHAMPLQRALTSVFAAIAEGRKSPQTHLPPKKADYEALTKALTSRGWTDRELQLFSDPRALARASPDHVCRLVQDWFAAQLSIKDQDVQLRLLVESLKPVVTG